MSLDAKSNQLYRFILGRNKYLHDVDVFAPPTDFEEKFIHLEGADARRFPTYKKFHQFMINIIKLTRRQKRRLYERQSLLAKGIEEPTPKAVPKKPTRQNFSTARKLPPSPGPIRAPPIKIRPVTYLLNKDSLNLPRTRISHPTTKPTPVPVRSKRHSTSSTRRRPSSQPRAPKSLRQKEAAIKEATVTNYRTIARPPADNSKQNPKSNSTADFKGSSDVATTSTSSVDVPYSPQPYLLGISTPPSYLPGPIETQLCTSSNRNIPELFCTPEKQNRKQSVTQRSPFSLSPILTPERPRTPTLRGQLAPKSLDILFNDLYVSDSE